MPFHNILTITKSDQAPCDSWLVLCWFSFSRCVCNSLVSHCFYNLWYFQRPHESSMMRQQKISLLELSSLVQTSRKLADCLASSQEQHKASGTNSAKRDLWKTFLSQGIQRRQQIMRTVSLWERPSSSVCRSSSLDQKKDWNQTKPNCKRPDHWLRLHKFWNFLVASCKVCRKIKRPKKTNLLSCNVLNLTNSHFSLIVGLWIIKNGQELVEIWPKTFLYTTWMYVPSVFTISQLNINEIAWNFNQSTGNWNIYYVCSACELILFLFGTINFTTKDQSQPVWTGFFFALWTD